MDTETESWLRAYYKHHNEALVKLLSRWASNPSFHLLNETVNTVGIYLARSFRKYGTY
jgi:hypothetical protein